jgi:hypothetical protein
MPAHGVPWALHCLQPGSCVHACSFAHPYEGTVQYNQQWHKILTEPGKTMEKYGLVPDSRIDQ